MALRLAGTLLAALALAACSSDLGGDWRNDAGRVYDRCSDWTLDYYVPIVFQSAKVMHEMGNDPGIFLGESAWPMGDDTAVAIGMEGVELCRENLPGSAAPNWREDIRCDTVAREATLAPAITTLTLQAQLGSPPAAPGRTLMDGYVAAYSACLS